MAGGAYPGHPRAGVGAVVVREGRVLLVKRKNPPAQGLWTIPGGRVRLGESLAQAARREALEETGIRVRPGLPVFAFDLIDRDGAGKIRFHYVVVDLLCEYESGEPLPGDDALEALFAGPEDLARLELDPATLRILEENPHLLQSESFPP